MRAPPISLRGLVLSGVALLAVGWSPESRALDCKENPQHACCRNPVCIPYIKSLQASPAQGLAPRGNKPLTVPTVDPVWQVPGKPVIDGQVKKPRVPTIPPIYREGRVYLSDADSVQAIQFESPNTPLWKYPENGRKAVSIGAADSDNLYVHDYESVVALDLGDGKPKWKFKAPAGTSAVTVDADTVTLYTEAGQATDLAPGTGAIVKPRKKPFTRPAPMTPLLSADRRVVVASLYPDEINAFDLESGADVWKVKLPAKPVAITSFQHNGQNVILVTTEDGQTSAYTPPNW